MPKSSKPKKSPGSVPFDQFSMPIYDPHTEWENVETGEPVETPPEAEALFYRLAILEGAKRKYAECEISEDDPYAKDKLLAFLCEERWPEFKIPRFVPSPNNLNQLEAWDRSRVEYEQIYAEHQRKPDYGEAADLAWAKWTNCPYSDAESLRLAALRGRKIYSKYPALKGHTYGNGEYVIIDTLTDNRAFHALDHLAERSDGVCVVVEKSDLATDWPPFALAMLHRLLIVGANISSQAEFPGDILEDVKRCVHFAVSELENGAQKYPGAYVLITARENDPCAKAWKSALSSIGAAAKVKVVPKLFGRMLAAKTGRQRPDLFLLCMTGHVPPEILLYDKAGAPEATLSPTSYRARQDAEEAARAAAELGRAQERSLNAHPYAGVLSAIGITGGSIADAGSA